MIETQMKLQSQLGQEKFVCQSLNWLEKGYFVDIGAAHPILINNTFFLERKLNWSGLSIDMGPENEHLTHCPEGLTKEAYMKLWEYERTCDFVCGDALEIDYKKLFKEKNVPKIIDYLSVDLEPADVTLEALKKLPFDEYQFRIITFEHDLYRNHDENVKILIEAREFLQQFGLHAIDIEKSLPHNEYDISKIRVQEDWFVNPSLIEGFVSPQQ